MEGYKKKKGFVFMALVLATIMLNKCAGKAYAQSPEFCGMSEQDMNACRPSYMKINPVPPSKACCFALAKADIVCFCNNWQSPLLPTYGIDPALAMALPAKCNLKANQRCLPA